MKPNKLLLVLNIFDLKLPVSSLACANTMSGCLTFISFSNCLKRLTVKRRLTGCLISISWVCTLLYLVIILSGLTININIVIVTGTTIKCKGKRLNFKLLRSKKYNISIKYVRLILIS